MKQWQNQVIQTFPLRSTAVQKWYLVIFGIFIVPILKRLLRKTLWKKLPFFNFFQISTMLQSITV